MSDKPIHEQMRGFIKESFNDLLLQDADHVGERLLHKLMNLFGELAQEVDSLKAEKQRTDTLREEHTAMTEFFLNATGCEINDIYSSRSGTEKQVRVQGTIEFEHCEFLMRLLEQKFTAYTKLPDVRY